MKSFKGVLTLLVFLASSISYAEPGFKSMPEEIQGQTLVTLDPVSWKAATLVDKSLNKIANDKKIVEQIKKNPRIEIPMSFKDSFVNNLCRMGRWMGDHPTISGVAGIGLGFCTSLALGQDPNGLLNFAVRGGSGLATMAVAHQLKETSTNYQKSLQDKYLDGIARREAIQESSSSIAH